jgi:hypothetical protein
VVRLRCILCPRGRHRASTGYMDRRQKFDNNGWVMATMGGISKGNGFSLVAPQGFPTGLFTGLPACR